MNRKLVRWTMALLVLFLTALMVGCSSEANSGEIQATPEGAVSVDSDFREFYRALGDQVLLGPAISAPFEQDSRKCQYTENVLMCLDPYLTDASRFSFYPLGKKFGISDTPDQQPAQSLDRVVDGFKIYPEFVSLYDRLNGALYVGRPLTKVRTNEAERRIEQYFENMAFYRRYDDPSGTVYLLPYGAYDCGMDCRYQSETAFIPQQMDVEQPFLQWMMRLGGPDVFGQVLSEPFVSADGLLVQIYENAVPCAPQDQPQAFQLCPVAKWLNMPAMPPGPKVYTEQNGVYFYPVLGDQGYHVPIDFDKFIATHGSKEISGQPFAEVMAVDAIYRQCFDNYCLDYNPTQPEGKRVKMAPLGSMYLKQIRPESAAPVEISQTPVTYTAEAVEIRINEANPTLANGQAQRFEMMVLNRADQRPLANIEASLDIVLPDGTVVSSHFPPTGTDGRSTVEVPSLPNIPNGSVVPYLVCLNVPSQKAICAAENFLIWNP
ncbi:hypothetical protein FDZ74_06100 [bacterium]|nr:MAG: hypothetical protein FDZ74_06100 [bacterium]